MSDREANIQRRDWLIPGLLLLGLALRVLYHLLYSSSIFWGDLTIDEKLHHAWASYIARGNVIGDTAFFRAPLYPYFLALLYKISGANLHVVHIVQHMIGLATGWLVYRVAREMFNYTTGALALIIYILTPTFIYFEGQILLDFLILPLNLLAFLFLYRAVGSEGWRNWILSGLFFGLSALTRPNVLLFLGFLGVTLLVLIWRRSDFRKAIIRVLILTATVLAVIAPVTIRNYVVSNDLVLIASQGGINFYLGNHHDATGLSAFMPTLGFAWDHQDTEYMAEQARGKELLPSEVSDYWYEQGVKFILDEPELFVPLFIKKLYHLANNNEISNNRSIQYVYNAIQLPRFLPFGVWFLLPLSIVGLVVYWRNTWTRLLTLFVVTYSFTLLMFFINSRFRLPILAVLTILSALGILAIVNMVRRRHYVRTALTASGVIVLSLLTTSNLYDYDFESGASEEYNLGNHLMETGRYDEALERFHNALSLRPDMNQVNLNIGNIHMKRGEPDSARVYYLAELKVTVDSVRAFTNLCVVERLSGNDSLSLYYGERAIALKPYFADAVVNYIIEARKLRLYGPALKTANESIEINPDDPDLYYYRGVIFFDLGRFDEATADFMRSLDLLSYEKQPSFLVAVELGSEQDKVESRMKTEAMIYYSLGTIAGQSGMPDSARSNLEKALVLDPSLIEAKVNLASALTQLGEFAEAERISLSVIESGNENPLVWYFVAVSRANAGSVAEAIAAADSALSISPDFAPAKSLKLHLQR